MTASVETVVKRLHHTFVGEGSVWPEGLSSSVDDPDVVAILSRLDGTGTNGVDVWFLVAADAG